MALAKSNDVQSRPVIGAGLILTVLVVIAALIAGQKQALAVLIGAMAGFSLYHASFGFTAAWRRIFAEQRGVGLRYQFLLIILTCAVSFPLIYYTSARGFVLPVSVGMLFGSLMFGFGMQFGGGCGSGTLFVAGGGSTRMCITLAFFVIGSLIGSAHVPWWNTIAFPDAVQSTLGIGDRFSYGMINRLGPMTAFLWLAGILGAIAVLTIWLEKRKHGDLEPPRKTMSLIHGPWSPREGAIALAIVGILSLLVIGQPWGVTFAFAVWGAKIASFAGVDVASWPYWSGWRAGVLENSVFNHSVSVMNFGIMAGALAAAGLAAKFNPIWTLSRVEIGTAVFGGLLMGYGARLAYGCNIGAYLGGLVSGSAHGWAWAVMAFIGSCLAVACKRRLGI
ncbi:MAG: YeeE/YedE family protein [Rhizobiaceae bacterium]|nr:YeeE/YedE family protein [Rhizobiaceae bacterium]